MSQNKSRLSVVSKLLISVILSCFSAGSLYAQQPSDVPLTNAAVVRLVKAGFKEKTIIAIINSRPNHFQLGTEQLIQLKQGGVSENIILSMLAQNSSFNISEDEWSDESFLKGSNGNSVDGNSSSPGLDIFGSSTGSKSQTRSRGTGGSNDNDNNLTGTATVRILRTPTEEGGAPARLERAPTLTNDSVIRLVE